jgi:hypothetical protein
MLRNLMVKSGVLRAYYDPRRQAERDAYSRVLETLCACRLPRSAESVRSTDGSC